MKIISFATKESDWKTPRMGIILENESGDLGYRLDCEKLFEPADRPSDPLDWFDMSGKWFQKAKETFLKVTTDSAALNEAKENGLLVDRADGDDRELQVRHGGVPHLVPALADPLPRHELVAQRRLGEDEVHPGPSPPAVTGEIPSLMSATVIMPR